jgi:hypothetical protein
LKKPLNIAGGLGKHTMMVLAANETIIKAMIWMTIKVLLGNISTHLIIFIFENDKQIKRALIDIRHSNKFSYATQQAGTRNCLF